MPDAATLVQWAEWFFLAYFLCVNGGYLLLVFLASFRLADYMGTVDFTDLPHVYTELEPPVTVLVPAYNEAASIVGSVRSLLQLRYSEFEVVVINDGSSDATLAELLAAFGLQEFPEAYRVRLATRQVRAVYRSTLHANLRVIDKENGGKADALNAGINAARYPLFCGVDADSMLQPESLRLLVQPFLTDPHTVACGGAVRLANGCEVSGGVLQQARLPKNPLALFQIVEYLRAFLFGRLGWAALNALLVISGAFGLFHKETVVGAGGYRVDTVGEDMELVVRLHRVLRQAKKPYRITFLPDPVCWTEAPEKLSTLRNQRVRWQRGLGESLMMNRALFCGRGTGLVGWFAFPFFVFFEWWGPFFEVVGYGVTIWAYWQGLLNFQAMLLFFSVAVGLGMLLSVSSLFLEERSFHIYTRFRQLLALLAASVVENFGYRQLITLFRLYGLMLAVVGVRARWGRMERRGSVRE